MEARYKFSIRGIKYEVVCAYWNNRWTIFREDQRESYILMSYNAGLGRLKAAIKKIESYKWARSAQYYGPFGDKLPNN